VDVAALAELLHETAQHHDPYEKTSPPHNWWDWYAPYLYAREHGSTQEQASAAAGRHVEEVRRSQANTANRY
jgi:hypothetical protein